MGKPFYVFHAMRFQLQEKPLSPYKGLKGLFIFITLLNFYGIYRAGLPVYLLTNKIDSTSKR